MDTFRIKISTKILDFVECLPRFRKGIISDLQSIREQQKIWSERYNGQRERPKESNVEFSQMALIITFEHENFHDAIKGLKKFFPENEDIHNFAKSLKESADKIHANSWHNLGYISREKGVYFPTVTVDESLPSSVKGVSLSFHRVLPSIACIIFEFQISNSVSKTLINIQSQSYLGLVEFKKFWPIRYFHRAYSIGLSSEQAIIHINKNKTLLRKGVENWVMKNFAWKSKIMNTISYVDVFKLSGNPNGGEECRIWLRENSRWLDEFGININDLNTLDGGNFLITKPRASVHGSIPLDVIVKFEPHNEPEFGDHFKYKVRAIAVPAILFSVIDKYKNNIEILRGNGFESLYRRRKLTRRNQYNILDLKRIIVILSRLEHEIIQSRHWIEHSISEVGELVNFLRKENVNLAKNTLANANWQIKQAKDAAAIIDSGLTNYLSIQNIYVMYKLQKWMFILSIVATIATIISVLSGWNTLKPLVLSWLNA